MTRVAISCAFFVVAIACGGSVTTNDDGGTDAGIAGDVVVTNDASTTDAAVGAPITGLTPGQWTWVDFPNAMCRDGTATGIGVSPSANGSTKLMIFLEGGGACFNSTTCGENPFHFDQTTFAAQFVAAESKLGIFSRTDTSNAVADYNMVYVPYCTGDVHAGNAPNTTVPGVVGPQQFVGYTNMTQYLARIVPTFPNTTRVLLAGQSAGGFGAALQYVQTTRNFGAGIPVDLLDDSGPLMGNPTLAACLEQQMTTLWNLGPFISQDCGSDCNDTANALLLYWEHLPKTYPNARFGFVDSTGDSVISTFFGFGAQNCTGFTAITPAAYEAGLLDMRTQVSADANAGLFLFGGTAHTSIVAAYTTRTTPGGDGGTVKLEDWVTALVGSSVTNAGP
jgi:hypothetical protein